MPQLAKLTMAPDSKNRVTGLLLVPLPWKVKAVVIVPHRCTVVPAPIWLAPLPQLEELLNQAGVCGLVVQAPWLLPLGVM